ncbi:MAG: type II toxin-antitoxin system VapC family toxin [Verrucomicrobiota bacterium]
MRLLDANVVIDALDSNSPWHGWAVQVLVEAIAADGAALNPVALSEVLVACADREAAVGEITGWGVELVALPPAVAIRASEAFARYLARCRSEGVPRSSRIPLPDFLIGAHAAHMGWPVITRDPSRFRTYFPELTLRCPVP